MADSGNQRQRSSLLSLVAVRERKRRRRPLYFRQGQRNNGAIGGRVRSLTRGEQSPARKLTVPSSCSLVFQLYYGSCSHLCSFLIVGDTADDRARRCGPD